MHSAQQIFSGTLEDGQFLLTCFQLLLQFDFPLKIYLRLRGSVVAQLFHLSCLLGVTIDVRLVVSCHELLLKAAQLHLAGDLF